jgi:hypothetical protein
MSAFKMTRRASCCVFGAAVLACATGRHALAVTRAAGGIHVDVAPLRENSGDPTAAWVARVMPGALAQALVEAGRPGTPVSVRIDYVILGPSSGEGGPAGSSPDQMIGAVIVGGVARPLRAETWYSLSAADAATTEASNYDRVYQLSRAFAYWAARGYSGT